MRLILNGQQGDLLQAICRLDWWRQHVLFICLIAAIVISIFSLAVVKTQSRQHFIDYQAMQYHFNQIEHQYAQLILEKGAYASQIHVMSVAQNKLNMVMPASSHILKQS
jgi:cell division protein FtsL